MQARLAVPLVALCAALAVAGCGSSKKSSSSSNPSPATTAPSSTPTTTPSKTKGGATVKLSADPSGQLAFNTTSLSAKAGKVTLDMSNPRGRELFKRLITVSDIVVENFTPHVLRDWGLDYPEMKRIKA